jgi:hypothetical protein
MNTIAIRAIGVAAPGLADWETARGVLAGENAYVPNELGKLALAGLPANERRRLSATMRLALHVGERALTAAGCEPAKTASVFTSATGDGDIIHGICEELARPEPGVSPTRFHNSVHNAPAGYWSIATRAHAASSAVGAHNASFAAGWIEAALLAEEVGAPVLLVAYDRPLPAPLDTKRPVAAPFACALLLDPHESTDALARVATLRDEGNEETRLDDPALESLRRGNPAARALPLLALLARNESGEVALPWMPDTPLTLTLK